MLRDREQRAERHDPGGWVVARRRTPWYRRLFGRLDRKSLAHRRPLPCLRYGTCDPRRTTGLGLGEAACARMEMASPTGRADRSTSTRISDETATRRRRVVRRVTLEYRTRRTPPLPPRRTRSTHVILGFEGVVAADRAATAAEEHR